MSSTLGVGSSRDLPVRGPIRLPGLAVLILLLASGAITAVLSGRAAPQYAGLEALLAIVAILGLAALAWNRAVRPGAAPGTAANLDMAPELAHALAPELAHELAHERVGDLVRERDAAVAASAAKSLYLTTVSHELRSPLNAIYGYAQLLERESAVSPREAARVIRRSAEHLNDLVEGLLDISMVEQGVMRVARDIVRLPAFLDQIARMFAPQAAAKGLAFRVETRGRLPEFVRADQKRLRQILFNLLTNAIKYTQRGEVALVVGHANDIATFAVRDTGPGIPAAIHEQIFTPFERGAEAASGSEGRGLGLAITRAIVHVLGGDIALESEPGAGAVFRVRLMLAEVAGHHEDTAPAPRILGYEGRRRHVLVLDDDVQQLAFVREVLGGLGFEVAAAPDGATALALAATQAFDLALLDIALTESSGWTIAAALRALGPRKQAPDLRIVMLSGNAHERFGPAPDAAADASAAAAASADAAAGPAAHDLFLVKPIEIGMLVDAIGEQLGLVWVREAPAADGVQPAPKPLGRADTEATPPLPDAARAAIGRLRDLLRIGHVRAVEAEIRALEAAAPEARDLVSALYANLDRFDLAAMTRQIEGL